MTDAVYAALKMDEVRHAPQKVRGVRVCACSLRW